MSITQGSFGTGFADGVRSGSYQNSTYQHGLQGIRLPSLYTYTITPQAAAANTVALSQTPVAAGYLTLTPTGAAASSDTVLGNAVIALDYPRTLSVTGTGGGVTAANYFISGYDVYNKFMVDEIIHPGGAVAVKGKKAFKYISQIWASAGTGAAITVGINDQFGLPYALFQPDDVIQAYSGGIQNIIQGVTPAMVTGTTTVLNPYVPTGANILLQHDGAGVAANYGWLYQGGIVANTSFVISSSDATDTDAVQYSAPGVYQVIVADQTIPATALTGDVRGVFGVQTASNGAHIQTITYYVYGADPEYSVNNPGANENQTEDLFYGVPQNTAGGPF